VITGVAGGAIYCGMTGCAMGAATGGIVVTGAHGDGGQVAATGATYVGAGGQTGAGGAQTGARLNHVHGHNGQTRAQQQPLAAGITATASKIRIFFMVLGLLEQQSGDYCFGRVV
jgi:hypothetical protein